MELSTHPEDHSCELVKRNSLKIFTTDTSMKCMDADIRTNENVSSWMNADTGYHDGFILGVILGLMLVSVPLDTYSRILRLLSIGESGAFKHG